MGFADKIANAQVTEGGVYPVPGLYPVVQVDTLKTFTSRRGDELFIAELDVLKSEVTARAVGSRMSWIANLSKHDAAPGNVKALLAAILGVSDEDIGANEAEAAVSDAQPAHGRLVRLEAVQITTKAGNPFTKCSWYALPESVQKDAAKLRKEAGFPPF